MPGYNPILRHWQNELKVFNKNLSLLRQALDANAIHDLRVAIKKLRSYFKLYLLLFENKEAENLFSGTSSLFSVLGKHRNIEMSSQLLLSSIGKNKEFLDFLILHLQTMQKQTEKYCKEALAKYEVNDLNELTKLIKADLENYSIEETFDKVKEIIGHSFEQIKHDLKHFEEKSHLVRKALKDIFYRLIIFENPPLSNAQIKMINKILDHLGDIQDREVLITNLKNFRKMILPKETVEYKVAKKIEEDSKNRKTGLLDKAEKMTQKLAEDL